MFHIKVNTIVQGHMDLKSNKKKLGIRPNFFFIILEII